MNPDERREQMMLAALFLSKFGRQALARLGFKSYTEAYNTIGYSLGGKPRSLKNYMQEFDPLFENGRLGWHRREMRSHCREMHERYGHLPIGEFYAILAPLLLPDDEGRALPEELREIEAIDDDSNSASAVGKRLMTGIAAERFFEACFPKLIAFANCELTNVTSFGCGFDFRIQPEGNRPFWAAEVKGLAGTSGDIAMTQKEFHVARHLRDRYYLCLVSNFSAKPKLSVFQNPVESDINFVRRVHTVVVESYHARLNASVEHPPSQ